MRSICNPAWAVGALVVLAAPVSAEPLSGPIPARVERVIDGDTVRVRAQIWIDQEVAVAVRLDGVDAPEIFRPACPAEREKAVEARDFASRFFTGDSATLRNVHNGKYAGRVVAKIQNAAGADLGDALVAAGLASFGETDWCRATS